MLQLNDPRWKELTSFFGEPADIPAAIDKWLASVGTKTEKEVYFEDLFELFLHQMTITNAAFAIVPWMMHVCARQDTKLRMIYLTHIGAVEAGRIEHGVYYNRDETEECPEWLMPEYHLSVRKARDVASDLMHHDNARAVKCGLVAIYPAFEGNATLAWAQWCARLRGFFSAAAPQLSAALALFASIS
jgi:hypothetical protein